MIPEKESDNEAMYVVELPHRRLEFAVSFPNPISKSHCIQFSLYIPATECGAVRQHRSGLGNGEHD